MHTDARFADAVTAAVAEIEARTDAEVVVVAAARSGSYGDLTLTGASAVALAALAFLLFVPYTVHPLLALVDVALVWAVARWGLAAPWFVRRVASAARQEAQVREAAAAAFHQEAVHSTPGRKALLVYASALEGRVELIPDVGLDAVIPRGRWADAARAFAHDDLDHFLAGLRHAGAILAEHVPHTGAARLELDDAPRVRP